MKRFYNAVFIVFILLALMFSVQQGMFEHLTDSNWVAHFIAEQGSFALLVLLAVGALFTAAGGPRQVIAFVFGFALGGLSGVNGCCA